MGENLISLPKQWGYSPPPGQQPEHNTKTEKQITTNKHPRICSA
jgi:hypothetical protein